MIRCIVEARNISASWMRVSVLFVMVVMHFVFGGNIGVICFPMSGCAVHR